MSSNNEYEIRDFWDQPLGRKLKEDSDKYHNETVIEEYKKMLSLGMNVKLVDIDGKFYIKPIINEK